MWEWKGKNYTRRKLPCIQYTSLLHTKYHLIQFNTHHIPLSFQFWLKSHHIPSIPIQHLPCHITYFSIFRLHSKLISLYGNLYFYLTINPPPPLLSISIRTHHIPLPCFPLGSRTNIVITLLYNGWLLVRLTLITVQVFSLVTGHTHYVPFLLPLTTGWGTLGNNIKTKY